MFFVLHLAIVHASLGNKAEVIRNLNLLNDHGYTSLQLLYAYGLMEDPYGAHYGINKDIGFIDAVSRIEARSQQVLADIHRDFPELFPDVK